MAYLDSRPSVSQVYNLLEQVMEDYSSSDEGESEDWEVKATWLGGDYEITGVNVDEDNEKVYLEMRASL